MRVFLSPAQVPSRGLASSGRHRGRTERRGLDLVRCRIDLEGARTVETNRVDKLLEAPAFSRRWWPATASVSGRDRMAELAIARMGGDEFVILVNGGRAGMDLCVRCPTWIACRVARTQTLITVEITSL